MNATGSSGQEQSALATRAKIVPVIAATLAPDTPLFVRFKSWRMIVISCAGQPQKSEVVRICSFDLLSAGFEMSAEGSISHGKGAGSTGAAANVDMKLVKKHSQLIWNDLRRATQHVVRQVGVTICQRGIEQVAAPHL